MKITFRDFDDALQAIEDTHNSDLQERDEEIESLKREIEDLKGKLKEKE